MLVNPSSIAAAYRRATLGSPGSSLAQSQSADHASLRIDAVRLLGALSVAHEQARALTDRHPGTAAARIHLVREHLRTARDLIIATIRETANDAMRPVQEPVRPSPGRCAKCGCGLYDPFTGQVLIHDVTRCSGRA